MIDPRRLLRDLFATAVATADPMRVVAAHLPARQAGRVVVIGAGKASARMAEAVEAEWGPCDGVVVTRYGHERPLRGVRVMSAAHPVPDAAGVAATQAILGAVAGLGPDDLVLALISGGASALLVAPAVPLADKQAVNAALLASGAPIGQMNIVRKHLSRVKGGQLAAACHPARLRALMISDVPGDDPAVIGSGPTVAEASTGADAQAVLDRWGIAASPAVRAALAASCVVPPGDARLARVENRVIAAPAQSLAAAAEVARAAGCDVEVLGDALEGEARDLAAAHARLARTRQAGLTRPLVLMSGGEVTVTRRGDGIGGPNAEYALAMAVALEGAPGIWAMAGDSDGVDGAAEVAGALITPDSLTRGPDAAAALAANDAHRYFARLGDQIVTGPTLTNVNDIRALLILPASSV